MRKIIVLIICSLLGLYIFSGCQTSQPEPPEVKPEIAANDYTNGTYTGFSNTGENGYAWAKVTIKNDDITDVKLMEITAQGNEKDYETYDYQPSVQAYQEMPSRFEEADSADVDVYSKATDSSKKYKEAVARALAYARGSETGSNFYEGKFQGESERTEYGYAVAIVTIKEDKMNDVKLKETDGEGEWKDFSTYKYEPAVQANEEMAERFVEENSIEVDLYSEATQSSIRYVEAVENALKHARKDLDYEIE